MLRSARSFLPKKKADEINEKGAGGS